jgi:hypothetical protein
MSVRPLSEERHAAAAAPRYVIPERQLAGLHEQRLDRPSGKRGFRLASGVGSPYGELEPPRHKRFQAVVRAQLERALSMCCVTFQQVIRRIDRTRIRALIIHVPGSRHVEEGIDQAAFIAVNAVRYERSMAIGEDRWFSSR